MLTVFCSLTQALRGVGGLVFDANGKRFANELGRRDYVTGEMWKNKPPFRLCLNKAAGEEIIWYIALLLKRLPLTHANRVFQVVHGLVKRAPNAVVLNLGAPSKRPSHVAAEGFGGKQSGALATHHYHLAFDGHHFLLAGFQFARFHHVVPGHVRSALGVECSGA